MLPHITNQIEEINMHPEVGAKITMGHFCIGLFVSILKEGHINPLIMDVVQLFAWIVAIAVGCLTVVGYLVKFFKK